MLNSVCPPDELRDDLAPGYHRGDRVAVAHGLAERDEVRNDAEAIEAPQRLAGAGVAGLDLVGDPERAGLVRQADEVPHISAIQVGDAVAGEQPVEDRRTWREPAVAKALQRRRERRRVEMAPAVGSGGSQVSTWSGAGAPSQSSGESAVVASVMPWYAKAVQSPPRRPVTALAMRQARSFASEPELTRITVSRPGGHVAISRSASPIAVGCRYRVWVLIRRLWRAIAADTRGCACPTHGTLL